MYYTYILSVVNFSDYDLILNKALIMNDEVSNVLDKKKIHRDRHSGT